MYEGPTYSRDYSRRMRRKEARIQRIKKTFYTAFTILGIGSGILIFSNKIVAASEEASTVQAETISGNDMQTLSSPGIEIQPEEIASDSALPAEIVVKQQGIPLVVIDAGHGGEDEGCSRGGVLEKDINLAIAKKVQSQLQAMSYQVVMIRDRDVYIAKEERVQYANDCQADIYISIHQNASEDNSVEGMEVWYDESRASADNKRLAQLIHQQTLQSTGALKRELRGDAQFYVTGKTEMSACLIETGFLSNAAERERLLDEQYQEQIAAGIVQGIMYYFTPKTMYLTFDDGPSEENTARVLDILKERNIKATFFLVGENVRKHPEIARRIVAEGHTIGIHCDSHDYGQLYASVDSYLADFEAAHQTVLEVTGVDTRIFRFPGGSINDHNKKTGQKIIKAMTERGYQYYDWNASVEDAVTYAEPEELIANGVETTLGRKKVIMLAHDVVYNTGICLEELLDRLPEYEMLPLTEEVEPIQF